MKRLTKRTESGHVYMDCTNCPLEGKFVNYSAAEHGCMQSLLQKLAEYEDTGLTPKQVREQVVSDEQIISAQLSDSTIKKIATECVKAQRVWLRALVGPR